MARNHIAKIRENAPQKNFSIIILAAGMGTRLSGESKPMLKVGSETLIKRQIKLLKKKYGQTADIISVLGYRNPEIINTIRKDCSIVINERFEYTNVTYSILLGIMAARYPRCLIVYGDLVFDFDALPEIGEESFVLVDNLQMKKEEIGVLVHGNTIVNLMYDTDIKWCQITYLTENYMDKLYEYCKPAHKHKHFGFEALNHCIAELGPLNMVKCGGKIVEVDTFKDLENAQDKFK